MGVGMFASVIIAKNGDHSLVLVKDTDQQGKQGW